MSAMPRPYEGRTRPHEPMSDIPIERASIGAMRAHPGPASFPRPVHGYLYGASKLSLRQAILASVFLETEPLPVPEVKIAKPPRRRSRNPRPRPEPKPWVRKRWIRPAPFSMSKPKVCKKRPEDIQTWRDPRLNVPRKPARPAPGWRPMTGADIEVLLSD